MSKSSKRNRRLAKAKAEMRQSRKQSLQVSLPVVPATVAPPFVESNTKPKHSKLFCSLSKACSRTWGLVVGIATVLGFIVLVPNLSVSTGSHVSAKDPFKSAFILKNEGYFPINDVNFEYLFNNVEGFDDLDRRVRVASIWIESSDDIKPIPGLARGESTSLIFPTTILKMHTSCDVQIIARYRPSFWFWNVTDKFRFATREDKNALIWYPKALSEPIYFTPSEGSNLFIHYTSFPGEKPIIYQNVPK